ncbi:unnamed protein product [Pleuronectes platessa]|uniref:Uncharacterized protein n=1 Tax=Pleuronectes platessa TaxID=8262 RepID=A0A9N7UVP9_PLEPL|nr:unnamed protein product [Pleuronectes platessa]
MSHKGVKNHQGHSYWSLWSKTCEVTGANIRRGLPKIFLSSLFFHPAEGGRLLSLLSSLQGRKAATASLSYIAKGEGLADPASFSIQPTTGGQRCSSQLTPLKEISSPFKLYKTPRSDAMSCRRTSTSI